MGCDWDFRINNVTWDHITTPVYRIIDIKQAMAERLVKKTLQFRFKRQLSLIPTDEYIDVIKMDRHFNWCLGAEWRHSI